MKRRKLSTKNFKMLNQGNKSKKLNLTQFHKKDETLFEYSHQNDLRSTIDLKKLECSCSTMFDQGICEHIVRLAYEYNFEIPGLKKQFKTIL